MCHCFSWSSVQTVTLEKDSDRQTVKKNAVRLSYRKIREKCGFKMRITKILKSVKRKITMCFLCCVCSLVREIQAVGWTDRMEMLEKK